MTQTSDNIPPSLNAELPPRSEPSLGEDPSDREVIIGPTALLETILRHPRRLIYQLKIGALGSLILWLSVIAVGFLAVYGIIVGSFSGGDQWWAAPGKLVLGMIATAVICLPSLYVFACLSGSVARLHQVTGALASLLGLMTLLLIGFGPVAWLFSQSTESVAMMGFFHLLFWLVAVRFGVRLLLSAFRHWGGLRSEAGLYTWVAIFLLVSLQMTTALRPLIGSDDILLNKNKKFFLAHWEDCMRNR